MVLWDSKGTVLPNADAELILQEDCLLVADEAYADFCDVTALSLFSKYDNLIVCRTFSKWAGLAGIVYCTALYTVLLCTAHTPSMPCV